MRSYGILIVDYRKMLKTNQNWRNKAQEHSISKVQKHENQFVSSVYISTNTFQIQLSHVIPEFRNSDRWLPLNVNKTNQNWRNKAPEHSISKVQNNENQFVHRFTSVQTHSRYNEVTWFQSSGIVIVDYRKTLKNQTNLAK